MLTLWVLFVLAIGSDNHGITDYKVFQDEKSCKAAQFLVTDSLVKQNFNKGSVSCLPLKVGSFS